MKKDLIIKLNKKSILGKSVYANRAFKKGEIVIKYNLKSLSKKEFENLPEKEKKFVHFHSGTLNLYSVPERYVNNSLNPNTIQDIKQRCDIALRGIKKGEEITTDSTKDDIS